MVRSRDNGIVESRETARVLRACHYAHQRSRVQNRERRCIQTLGERELYVSFPAFLSRRGRKTESNSTAPSRTILTPQSSSLFTPRVPRVSSIPATISSFRRCAMRDTRDENRFPLRKYFITIYLPLHIKIFSIQPLCIHL